MNDDDVQNCINIARNFLRAQMSGRNMVYLYEVWHIYNFILELENVIFT